MSIVEQIQKQIELEARINGLNNQIREKDIEISSISDKIEDTEMAKAENVSARDKADNEIIQADRQVESSQRTLDEAKKHLRVCLEAKSKAEKEREKYSDEFFNNFNIEMTGLDVKRGEAEKQKEALLSELKNVHVEKEFLQSELKRQGYELNIGEQARPKIHSL